MVYIDPQELEWFPYVKTWMDGYEDSLKEEVREFLLALFTRYINDGLKFVNKKCTQSINQVDISKVTMLCKLLEALLFGPNGPDFGMDATKLNTILCTTFVFAFVWSIGGNLIEGNWDAFDTFTRNLFEDNGDAKVSTFITADTCSCHDSKFITDLKSCNMRLSQQCFW